LGEGRVLILPLFLNGLTLPEDHPVGDITGKLSVSPPICSGTEAKTAAARPFGLVTEISVAPRGLTAASSQLWGAQSKLTGAAETA
jgi:hypothetical protein